MRNKIFLMIGVLVIVMAACNSSGRKNVQGDGHNSRISLDWAGSYEGMLPCADCEGIMVKIILKDDGSYYKNYAYVKDGEEDSFLSHGQFEWTEDGNVIVLTEGDDVQKYKVAEGYLKHLDREGRQVEGDLAEFYVLHKTGSFEDCIPEHRGIEDKTWALTSFMCKRINQSGRTHYIMFITDGNRMSSKVGCNIINSSYELDGDSGIRFSAMLSTRMYCHDNDIEDEYIRQLQDIDGYRLNEDGRQLTLLRGENVIAGYLLID